MVKEKKIALYSILALLFVLTAFAFTLYFGLGSAFSVKAESNATVSGYEAQIKELEEREAELKKQIEELKKDSSALQELLYTLAQQGTNIHDKIEAAKALISELEAQISEKEKQIAQTEEDIEDREEIFRQRLRLAHEDVNVDYLTLLFCTDGIVDFFSNLDRVSAMLSYDKRLLDGHKDKQQSLEDSFAQLKAQKEKHSEYQATLQESKLAVERQQAQTQLLIDEIKANRSEYENEIKEIQAEAEKTEKELQAYLKKLEEEKNKDYMVKGQLQWPIKTDTLGYNRITSTFGYRDLVVDGNDVSNHKGLDIGVKYVNLYACGAGEVVTSTYSSSYGYYVVIDHGGGISTLYAHMSKIDVKKGDKVKTGQYIGVSGNSGWSEGAHLHLEIRINGVPKDPLSVTDKKGEYYLSRPSNLYFVD